MKKIVAAVALMSVAGVATAAENQVQLTAEFFKGTERLYSMSQTVQDGQTAGLNDVTKREYVKSAQVVRSANGEIKGKPKYEKGVLNLGFDAYVTPRVLSTGEIRVQSKFSYNQLVEMKIAKVDGVEIETPMTHLVASEPQFIAESGKPITGFAFATSGGEYRLVITATKL